MRAAVERLEVAWPTYSDWVAAGIALALVVAAWGLAWLAGRWLGTRLATFWENRAGGRGEALAHRMCDLTRYFAGTLIVAVILNADAWRPLAAILLGIALAAWAALL